MPFTRPTIASAATAPTERARLIRDLHAAYVRLTGLTLGLDMAREAAWFEFTRKGWVVADLELVIRHLRAGIRAERRQPGALRFSNLVVMLDRFEEDLAEARALARRPRVDADRASVLRATGRPAAAPATDARPVGDILAAEKAFAEFRQLKEKL